MFSIRKVVSASFTTTILPLTCTVAHSMPTNVVGDVFVGVQGGQVFQYTQSGTLVQKLQSPNINTEDTGMVFDSSGILYSTNFQSNQIVKYNSNGSFIGTFGSGSNGTDANLWQLSKKLNLYVQLTELTTF